MEAVIHIKYEGGEKRSGIIVIGPIINNRVERLWKL